MSFSFDDDPGAWGGIKPTPTTGDIVKDALKKEQLLKDIATSQSDLRAILARVKSVQAEVDKLMSGNETLQMYIDNLTVQMAKQRP